MKALPLHHPACRMQGPSVPIPAGMVLPRGVEALGLLPDAPATLGWDDVPQGVTALRLTVAIDDRSVPLARIHAHLAASGQPLGTFDIRYSYPFQPFEIPLSEEQGRRACRQGIRLLLEGADHYHLIAGTRPAEAALQPHLLTPDATVSRMEQMVRRLLSPAGRQPFGWLVGCVTDGLIDLAQARPELGADQALREQFLQVFVPDGDLHYDAPGSKPMHNSYYGIEATLPLAALVQMQPQHHAVERAVDFWRSRRDAQGCIRDQTITSEGAYTVGWPLAKVAQVLKQEAWRPWAIDQLLHRARINMPEGARDRQGRPGVIFQKVDQQHQRALPNWARGVAWLLLGFARSMAFGDLRDPRLDPRFTQMAAIALRHQRERGLWGNFLDDPASPVDTSGSAGIAAALAIGARHGLLSPAAKQAAQRALAALEQYLTPDGYLTGCAQLNKGGEALQRSDYRVISQMGMGLMLQLYAALNAG